VREAIIVFNASSASVKFGTYEIAAKRTLSQSEASAIFPEGSDPLAAEFSQGERTC
jgi:hypothetical protein